MGSRASDLTTEGASPDYGRTSSDPALGLRSTRSALSTGWDLSSFSNSASAGGQLEHPSDVNSSTSTGVRAVPSLTDPALALVPGMYGRCSDVENEIAANPINGNQRRIMAASLAD